MGTPVLGSVDTPPARTRERLAGPLRLAAAWWPPVLAFLGSNLVFWYAARRYGYHWFRTASRIRYDA
jgi:uncharacterized membrane protein